MGEIRAVLQSCDPVLLDSSDDQDFAEAAQMVQHLTESRRVQKVLWRQLFVLDSMMSLLEGLESSEQLITQSYPPQPEGAARGKWKALKAESRSGAEQMETLLRSLQDKIQQINNRRNTLKQLVQHLQGKKQQGDQLFESLQKSQDALRSCEHQVTVLRAELEAVLGHQIGRQRLRDDLQLHISASQDTMQINLLTLNQSELCVELKPRPSSDLMSNELEPLKLSVTWSHDDRFTLQVNEGTAGLVEGCMSGCWAELSAALLEVMQCYVGQAELLTEIQTLRSSFAIDWRPAQRLLVYLKTALLVCHLQVEEGYPGNGRACLLSVQRDGQPVDTSGLKPHSSDLSLTDWLVFLCNSSSLV